MMSADPRGKAGCGDMSDRCQCRDGDLHSIGMEWNDTHRLAVDNARNLDRKLAFKLMQSFHQRFPLGRARSVCSLPPSVRTRDPREYRALTMGSLAMSGTLKVAS